MVDVILGLQWGDEGKGKIVDFFAPKYDVIARFQGGPNAGHTIIVGDETFKIRQTPSGGTQLLPGAEVQLNVGKRAAAEPEEKEPEEEESLEGETP